MKKIFALIAWASPIVFIPVLTIIQGYWALWDYRGAVSSSCLDCSLFSDLLLSSTLPIIGCIPLYIFFAWIKPSLRVRAVCFAAMLVISWICINTLIFDEREASWSTYTHVWLFGLILSLSPVVAAGTFMGFLYYLAGLKLSAATE